MKLESDWTNYSKNYSRISLQDAFSSIEVPISSFLNSISLEKYFYKPEDHWSVEQNVKHLIKTTFPVVFSLSLPKFCFFIFGKGGVSRDFEGIVRDYRNQLKLFNHAGIFQPFTLSTLEDHRIKDFQVKSLLKTYKDICSALTYWKESDLDDCRLPHPLLGMLTIREMLFLTIYHQYHHLSIVSERIYGD